MLWVLIAVASAYSVPKTSKHGDLTTYYGRLNDFNVAAKQYESLGLGMQSLRDINAEEAVFCIELDLVIKSTDNFPLSPYMKDFTSVETLICRVLYEKFMGVRGGFLNDYIHTLPTHITSPREWSQSHLALFRRLNIFEGFENFFNSTVEYEKIKQVFRKVYAPPPEVFDYGTYVWASSVVLSRSLTYKNSTTGVIVMTLSPYIDLVNYWPNPYSYQGESFAVNDQEQCIIATRPIKAGDQVFVEYTKAESSVFFYTYQFNLELNPHDSIIYTYTGTMQTETKEFKLKTREVNLQALELFTHDAGLPQKIRPNLRNYFMRIISGDKVKPLLAAMLIYKNQFMDGLKLTGRPGLREIRRLTPKDEYEKSIISFAAASRRTMYNHLLVLHREMIYMFYKLLF